MTTPSRARVNRPEPPYPQDDYDHTVPCCEAVHYDGWLCTRPAGHHGAHEASHLDRRVRAVWLD